MTLTPYRLDQLRRYNNPELFAEIERQAKEIERLRKALNDAAVVIERMGNAVSRAGCSPELDRVIAALAKLGEQRDG